MGTVFARLKVPAPDGSGAIDDHGVHAFIVPLRDADNQCFPGVEIKDCGYKVRQKSSRFGRGFIGHKHQHWVQDMVAPCKSASQPETEVVLTSP